MCIMTPLSLFLYRLQEGEDVRYAEELDEDGAALEDADEDEEHDTEDEEDEMEKG